MTIKEPHGAYVRSAPDGSGIELVIWRGHALTVEPLTRRRAHELAVALGDAALRAEMRMEGEFHL